MCVSANVDRLRTGLQNREPNAREADRAAPITILNLIRRRPRCKRTREHLRPHSENSVTTGTFVRSDAAAEEIDMKLSRRSLLKVAFGIPTATWLSNYRANAAPHTGQVKITKIKTMGLENVGDGCLI